MTVKSLEELALQDSVIGGDLAQIAQLCSPIDVVPAQALSLT